MAPSAPWKYGTLYTYAYSALEACVYMSKKLGLISYGNYRGSIFRGGYVFEEELGSIGATDDRLDSD